MRAEPESKAPRSSPTLRPQAGEAGDRRSAPLRGDGLGVKWPRICASALVAFALATQALLTGCVPAVIAAGAGGAALVATDRRTPGTQVDDEGIELKIVDQANTQYGDRIHLNVTSYNGVVLLTGEVPDQGAWASVGNLAKNTAKVRVVHNELVAAPNSDLSARTNDSYITSKVKARMVEANKFPPNAVKVVTERGVVYLMGIVTRAEGAAAGETAATTDGVVRVVKVFEYRA
jgi:osmotically-inducible protein OsmY